MSPETRQSLMGRNFRTLSLRSLADSVENELEEINDIYESKLEYPHGYVLVIVK